MSGNGPNSQKENPISVNFSPSLLFNQKTKTKQKILKIQLTSYWFKSLSGNSAKKWLAFTIHLVPTWPNPGLGAKFKDLLELGKPTSISHV